MHENNPLLFQLGKNTRGQWVARDPASGNMALFDSTEGIVLKPGTSPTAELVTAFTVVLALVRACDECTDHDGCSPYKA